MKLPKTIRGYILLMRQLEKDIHPSWCKGFELLSKHDQELLNTLDTEISNYMNEIKAYNLITEGVSK